jgi:hypothetical protein
MIENKSQVMIETENQAHKERRVNPMKRLKYDLLSQLAVYQGLHGHSVDPDTRSYYWGKMKGIQFAIDLLNTSMETGSK